MPSIAMKIRIRIEISCIRQMHRRCARMRDPWWNLRINPWETPGFGAHSHGADWLRLFHGPVANWPAASSMERVAAFPRGRQGFSTGGRTRARPLRNLEHWRILEALPRVVWHGDMDPVSPLSDRYTVPAAMVVDVCFWILNFETRQVQT
jgi:hypothetical protein